jgi:hypothetical protein
VVISVKGVALSASYSNNNKPLERKMDFAVPGLLYDKAQDRLMSTSTSQSEARKGALASCPSWAV